MGRWAPTQVTDWRGSEWDSFVDAQPVFAYAGYRSGFRQDLLRDSGSGQRCRRCYHTREFPSVPHLGPSPWLSCVENENFVLQVQRVPQ